VLKLRNDLAHLFAVKGNVFIEELLDTVGTKVKENRNLLQLIIIRGLIDMNDIGKDFGQCRKDIGINLPLNFGQKVPKDSQLIHINEHLFANASQQPVQRILEIVLSAEWHLDDLFDYGLDDGVLLLHVGFVQFGVLGLLEFELEVQFEGLLFLFHLHQFYITKILTLTLVFITYKIICLL
jgi:hypothetical protein